MLDLTVKPTLRFRQALGTFATGVTVATTIDAQGRARGFTANSFTSVSLEPPLILICLANDAEGCAVFTGAERFCVNVLAEDQQHISAVFASPGEDRFNGIAWQPGNGGNPIIAGTISWFECERYNVVDAGDHTILIGKVIEYEASSRSPLIYCGGSYVEFGLLQQAMEYASSSLTTRIAAIVDCQGLIPMVRKTDTGKLTLPSAKRVGAIGDDDSLAGKLAKNGIAAAIPFVCAVFEDARRRSHNVVYRGFAESVDTTRLKDFELVALDAIPWDELSDHVLRTLLQRYCEERERDAFGVYVGDTEKGAVHTLHVDQ